jgi:MFS family permease
VLDFLPAFLVDLAAYVAIFTLQHRLDARLAAEGRSSELALALFSACYTVSYVLGCMKIAPLTDRTGMRRRSIALGLGLGVALVLVLLALALVGHEPTPAGLDVAMFVLGVACAFFWPAFQARVGDRAGRDRLGAALGRFNVGWTAGKGLGLFLAGYLYEWAPLDGRVGLGAATAAFALAFFVQVVFDRESGKGEGKAGPELTEQAPGVKRGFLVAALVTNFAVWGVQATVIALVPQLGRDLSLGPVREGWLLATLVLAQAATFLILSGSTRWNYARAPLLLTAPLACVAAVAFFLAPSLEWALVAALATGLLTGASYSASIFYSLDYDARRGLRMGVNEAALGLGSLLPLAGSALAERSHESRLPYLFVAWVSLGAALATGAALRPRRVAA